MPRSKRNKLVSLTATTKRPARENNERLYSQIQECVDTYPNIFVFSVDNMRNTHLKEVRSELSDSRYFPLLLHSVAHLPSHHIAGEGSQTGTTEQIRH